MNHPTNLNSAVNRSKDRRDRTRDRRARSLEFRKLLRLDAEFQESRWCRSGPVLAASRSVVARFAWRQLAGLASTWPDSKVPRRVCYHAYIERPRTDISKNDRHGGVADRLDPAILFPPRGRSRRCQRPGRGGGMELPVAARRLVEYCNRLAASRGEVHTARGPQLKDGFRAPRSSPPMSAVLTAGSSTLSCVMNSAAGAGRLDFGTRSCRQPRRNRDAC